MHIVITGASRGIGAELAARFRAEGHEVTGTGRRGGGDLVALDVTRPEEFTALAAHVGARPVDLLICNAGIYPDKGQSLDTGYPAAMWAESLATNVTGVFLTVQTLLPNLRTAEAAKIAIISSQMASHTRAPGGSYIYRASKAAALNLGRNLAADLAPEGISVGIYHPGWVRTDMGGAAAEISVTEAAHGLIARFAALGPASTGCFETWDGRAHPY
ncbi:SDR family NAD(P)-dependent oxidoreductase [Roseovarius autotrophicus]|uniref:SDR family NAD(P)-dependent oxidoreductase n=1 Tax=Roseovarius autotrophicus TaxID=2824121 RepID=UPI0019F532A4|nr:SDR family NAD(P)-dependent oxidoreductase [Roseovarius autotrophicus]MBE0452419.1 SDR family NAD(P)-dependent oxidoreductase [Roseovarius sp.]